MMMTPLHSAILLVLLLLVCGGTEASVAESTHRNLQQQCSGTEQADMVNCDQTNNCDHQTNCDVDLFFVATANECNDCTCVQTKSVRLSLVALCVLTNLKNI
mmetsp:Transcript_9349/g.15531  ORF Transcript_9349/g.15531 Transcript_9349/m.15531 type:complete len:102 (+) Transcript_9349:63-368(+)